MDDVFTGQTPSAPPLPPTPSAPPMSSSALGRGDPPSYNAAMNPLITPQETEGQRMRRMIMTEFGRELPTYDEAVARMNEGLLFTNRVRQAHYMFINDPRSFGSEEDNFDEERRVFRDKSARFVADSRARGPALMDVDEETRKGGEEENEGIKTRLRMNRDEVLKYMVDALEEAMFEDGGLTDMQLMSEANLMFPETSNAMLLGLVDVARGMVDRKRNSFFGTGANEESKKKLDDLLEADFEKLEVHPYSRQKIDEMTGYDYRIAEFGPGPDEVRVLTDEENAEYQRQRDFERELEEQAKLDADPDRSRRGRTALSEFRRNQEEGGVLGLRFVGDGFLT